MKLVGKILWWDKKDQNGIIVDASGSEYYFDVSIVEGRRTSSIRPGTVVQFKINSAVDRIDCATSVQIPTANIKKKLEKEFQRGLQLSLQFSVGA